MSGPHRVIETIADMELEGGGITILGSQTLDGIWSFWTGGISIDLDENDHETWHAWSSQPVSHLDLVVPDNWPIFYPTTIHPDFVEWFRAHYEHARASLPASQRQYQEKHRHGHWRGVLGLPR